MIQLNHHTKSKTTDTVPVVLLFQKFLDISYFS